MTTGESKPLSDLTPIEARILAEQSLRRIAILEQELAEVRGERDAALESRQNQVLAFVKTTDGQRERIEELQQALKHAAEHLILASGVAASDRSRADIQELAATAEQVLAGRALAGEKVKEEPWQADREE